MPSRAYVAHDHAVSVVRMYFQMVVVGLVLAVVLYAALMAGFLSRVRRCPYSGDSHRQWPAAHCQRASCQPAASDRNV